MGCCGQYTGNYETPKYMHMENKNEQSKVGEGASQAIKDAVAEGDRLRAEMTKGSQSASTTSTTKKA